MIRKEKDGIVYYEFEHLAKTGLVRHCFSTRIGGVSQAPYDTMNLAYHMGDAQDQVDENFNRIAHAVRLDPAQITMTKQNHGSDVQVVAKGDAVIAKTDGLVTCEPGLVLTSYYADCVPLFFLDPIQGVVANAHSGWRGTLAGIGANVVDQMVRAFGSDPSKLLVGIGPSICMNHFEVGKEVIDAFRLNHPSSQKHAKRKANGKWHLDLTKIIVDQLLEKGILCANIEVADLCTFGNPDLFFSHRRDQNARGNMAALLALN